MEVYLFDFDKTIYDGDSSLDFFLYCLKKKPVLIFLIPYMFLNIILFKLKLINKTRMKEKLFKFIIFFKDIDVIIKLFWKENNKKIKAFYRNRVRDMDIIISASPEFLLKPILSKYAVKDVIATKMNKLTGKISGENCYGTEKVKRFFEKYPNAKILEMYSDSYSDAPLLNLSIKSYIVKGNRFIKYKKQ